MAESEKKYKIKTWVIAGAALVVILLCIVVVVMLMSGKETRQTGSSENYTITALTCEASAPEGAFFSAAADTVKHTVKVTFRDGKPDKMTYGYVGKFDTNEKAEAMISSYHANYNIDMSGNGLEPESLTPTFVAVDREARINLYTAVNNLNSGIAKFFFLPTGEYNKIQNYSEKSVQKIYENVGFKCESNK